MLDIRAAIFPMLLFNRLITNPRINETICFDIDEGIFSLISSLCSIFDPSVFIISAIDLLRSAIILVLAKLLTRRIVRSFKYILTSSLVLSNRMLMSLLLTASLSGKGAEGGGACMGLPIGLK